VNQCYSEILNQCYSEIFCAIFYFIIRIIEPGPVTVAVLSEAWVLPVGCRDRGFESRLRHGCFSASFCDVLSCVGRGLATG
jgi:hypothetical protein